MAWHISNKQYLPKAHKPSLGLNLTCIIQLKNTKSSESIYFIPSPRIQPGHVMSEFQLLEVVSAIQRRNGRGFVAAVQFQVPFWQTLICCHVLAVKCSCNHTMETINNSETQIYTIHYTYNFKFSFFWCDWVLGTMPCSGSIVSALNEDDEREKSNYLMENLPQCIFLLKDYMGWPGTETVCAVNQHVAAWGITQVMTNLRLLKLLNSC